MVIMWHSHTYIHHVSGSGGPSTFQVGPASRSMQLLMLNGASDPPHGFQKPTRSSYSDMREATRKLGSEEFSHRCPTITSLTFCLAQHLDELLIAWWCHVWPPTRGRSPFSGQCHLVNIYIYQTLFVMQVDMFQWNFSRGTKKGREKKRDGKKDRPVWDVFGERGCH